MVSGRRIGTGVALGVLALPSWAWGQWIVQYDTLTVVEAAYLYAGLGLQDVLRASSLRFLVPTIVICGIFWLLYKRRLSAMPTPLFGVFAYVINCVLITVAERVRKGDGIGHLIRRIR